MSASATGVRVGLAVAAAVAAIAACFVPAMSGRGSGSVATGPQLAARAVNPVTDLPSTATSTSAPAAPASSAARPTHQAPKPSAHRTTAPPRVSSAGPPHRAAAPVVNRPAHRAAAKSTRPAARPTHRATTTHPASSGYQASSIAYSVLSQLNAQRHSVGAAPLRMNSELVSSAHRHNLAMAKANEMSHQLPGEAYFTDRIRAAGYSFHYAGENIAWNSDTSTAGALELGNDMFAEGPGGEHWVNITSKHFVDVGVDVYIDTVHHKLWLTEDFGSR